jgi:hypothetical protein
VEQVDGADCGAGGRKEQCGAGGRSRMEPLLQLDQNQVS